MIGVIGITLAVLAVLIMISVKPGAVPPGAQNAAETFCGLNCAHRGLHTDDRKIPENSIAAFKAARERGYGVEFDVQMTADEKVVVFHDHTLLRVCGVDKMLCDMTYEELSQYRLFDTDEKIPLLEEALEVLGDTPIIVEIKPVKDKKALLCEKTLDLLNTKGKYWCIESFDPRICRWFKKNAPDVLRGQLSCPADDYIQSGISKMTSFILGNMLFNFMSRPHFVAYKNIRFPLLVKMCMIMKPLKAAWTITPDQDIQKIESSNDIIIFEHYMPAPRFRDC